MHSCIQWRSKALSLRGPGSTVTWGPSIPSAGPQGLKLEAQSAESGGGALGRVFFSCVEFFWPRTWVSPGARGPGSLNRLKPWFLRHWLYPPSSTDNNDSR